MIGNHKTIPTKSETANPNPIVVSINQKILFFSKKRTNDKTPNQKNARSKVSCITLVCESQTCGNRIKGINEKSAVSFVNSFLINKKNIRVDKIPKTAETKHIGQTAGETGSLGEIA